MHQQCKNNELNEANVMFSNVISNFFIIDLKLFKDLHFKEILPFAEVSWSYARVTLGSTIIY